MTTKTQCAFIERGITDMCSRCGRPYADHPHSVQDEDYTISFPHSFRSQPIPRYRRDEDAVDGWWWPDGRWDFF